MENFKFTMLAHILLGGLGAIAFFLAAVLFVAMLLSLASVASMSFWVPLGLGLGGLVLFGIDAFVIFRAV